MKKILKILLILACLLFFAFSWLFFQIYRTAQFDLAEPADAIAVLGAAAYSGKPSPVLKARLDHGLELYNKGFAPLIIATGGTHPGEKFSEGATGKKYLIEKGILQQNIIAEEKSLTTKENIINIAEIVQRKKLKRIIIVSDPFHMYRAKIIAEDLGIEVLTSPTTTSPISKNFWLELKYMGRETLLSALEILGGR